MLPEASSDSEMKKIFMYPPDSTIFSVAYLSEKIIIRKNNVLKIGAYLEVLFVFTLKFTTFELKWKLQRFGMAVDVVPSRN